MVTQSSEIKVLSKSDTEMVRSFLSNAGSSLNSFRYFEKRGLDVIKNHLVTCVLMNNNTPVGYGHLDQDNDKVWLGIAVAEEFKGKGFGTHILKFLLTKAKENKLPTVCLTVDVSNETAISLYKRLGFTLVNKMNSDVYLMKHYNIEEC